MTHLVVTMHPVPAERRNALVRFLTDAVSQVLNLTPAQRARVTICITPYVATHTAIGGKLINERKPETFLHVELFCAVRSYEQKQQLVWHVTGAMADALFLTPLQRECVTVFVHPFEPGDIAQGGGLISEMARL